MIKWLYNRYKSDFIKLYQEECRPKSNFANMEYRFTDSNGKKYYGFTDEMAMSMDRFGYWEEFMIWWSNGLSEKIMHEYLDVIDDAIEQGILPKKDRDKNKFSPAVIIGVVSKQIRSAKDMSKPYDLVMNMLACQLIREDEDLLTYNKAIQKEKVKQFMEEVENDNAFFLNFSEYKHLFASTITSPEDYLTSIKESQKIHQKVVEEIKLLAQRNS